MERLPPSFEREMRACDSYVFFNPLYVRDVHVDVRKAAFRKHFFCRVEYLDFFNRFFLLIFFVCLVWFVSYFRFDWIFCCFDVWSFCDRSLSECWFWIGMKIIWRYYLMKKYQVPFFYSLRLFLSSFLPELSKLKMPMINARRKILNSAIYVILHNIFFLRLFFKRPWYDMIWFCSVNIEMNEKSCITIITRYIRLLDKSVENKIFITPKY